MTTLAAVDFTGVALVIGSIATLIGVLGAQYLAIRAVRSRVEDTHAIAEVIKTSVDTLNESTGGELAAADETRRIELIPREQRTEKEQRHIDTAPPAEPPQGPTR
jgi:hypothetical protein